MLPWCWETSFRPPISGTTAESTESQWSNTLVNCVDTCLQNPRYSAMWRVVLAFCKLFRGSAWEVATYNAAVFRPSWYFELSNNRDKELNKAKRTLVSEDTRAATSMRHFTWSARKLAHWPKWFFLGWGVWGFGMGAHGMPSPELDLAWLPSYVCMFVCVCVWERERERKRDAVYFCSLTWIWNTESDWLLAMVCVGMCGKSSKRDSRSRRSWNSTQLQKVRRDSSTSPTRLVLWEDVHLYW